MSDLSFNKIAAAALTTGLMVIGLNELSHAMFHTEKPEEDGYFIEVALPDDPDGPVEEEGPVDYGLLLASADIEAGKRVANKCVTCHIFEQGGGALQGPALWNIVGAGKAQDAGFRYSSALSDLDGSWGYQELDEYLTRPSAYAPGTAMNFIGLKKEEDRINIIAYMRAQADAPFPLPDPLPEEAPVEAEAVDGAVLEEAALDEGALDATVDEISETLDAPLADVPGVEEAAADAGAEIVESVEDAGEAIVEAE